MQSPEQWQMSKETRTRHQFTSRVNSGHDVSEYSLSKHWNIAVSNFSVFQKKVSGRCPGHTPGWCSSKLCLDHCWKGIRTMWMSLTCCFSSTSDTLFGVIWITNLWNFKFAGFHVYQLSIDHNARSTRLAHRYTSPPRPTRTCESVH